MESIGRIRNGMKFGFMLVTFVGVIHYDYGNDYMAYYNLYNDIVNSQFSWSNLINGYIYKELGWALINYLFKYLGGFFMMVAVLNIIQNTIYYKFIKKNVGRTWWPMAVFIYLFSTNFYLLNFSMMRQGLVIAIFVGLWEYIKEKRWMIALGGLLCAYLIHSSALILLPFAFLGYLPFKKGRLTATIFIAVFIALWISQDLMEDLFTSMMVIEDIQDYANSYGKRDVAVSYGLGFLISLIPLCVSIYYFMFNKGKDRTDRGLVALSSLGFLIVPFTQVIPLVDRVAMYFNVFGICSIGITYSSIRSKILRYLLLTLYMLIMLYDYWRFFNEGIYSEHYIRFKSVFTLLYEKWQMTYLLH
jgi:hypothetical protein